MAVNLESPLRLSLAAAGIRSSAIRDLLAITERPEIISLAGGLPSPAAFPVDAIAIAAAEVLAHPSDADAALQYAPTAGYAPLRGWVAGQHGVDPDRVVVTHGSQQAMELVARALLDPGDVVALADPAYVGALQAFRLAGAELLGIPSDEHGLRVDLLADRLAAGARPALVYVVANFDNPSGATLSLERRHALAALADRYGFVVVDDDPYGALRWSGAALPGLATLTDRAVTLGSVSKVLSPGLRVGWAVAPPKLAATLVLLKQAVDLQATTFTQHIVHRVLTGTGFLAPHVAGLRTRYRGQCDALAGALRSELGDRIEFTAPDGGMFLWARMPGVDTRALLAGAIEQGTAFVPGAEFSVGAGRADALRLSFATAPAADLAEAAHRLALALG